MKQQKKRAANPKAELRPLPYQTSWKHTWLYGLLLAAITILAYARACRGEFLWDDDANIINNLTLRSLAGLRQIWLQPGATQQYYPVTHTSFWVEYHLWGAQPTGYHVTNILLHALSAVLLWKILQRLKAPGAWLGAALFALHPVGVESVAWITERKNTLASVFYLGSLLAGLRFWLPELARSSAAPMTAAAASKGHGPWKYYWGTLALYLCALGSKTATIGLPAVILLLVWWKRRRVAWREVFPLLPFVVMAAALGLITLWVEKNDLGAVGKSWELSPVERCLLAGRVFWFYLGKLAWPQPLMFMYPRWTIQTWNPLAWLPALALVAGMAVLWWKRKTWGRPGLLAAGYFIVMLFPVMGFFNVYFFKFSFVCDHFQYLACMGPLALAAAGITAGLGHYRKRITLLVPALLLLGLGALTWRQTGVYQNRETLWRDTLAHNPDCSMAHNNLGFVLLATGRAQEEAIAQFQLAVQSEPENAEAHNNLGTILLRADKVDEAMEQFQMALQIKPGYSAARVNLANALLQIGRVNEAIQDYQMALQIAPDDMAAHVNLGDALFHQGRAEEATGHYETAIKLAESAGRQDVTEQLRAELKRQQLGVGNKGAR